MARPRKNNAEYFSHDSNMRNDSKVKALRNKYGLEGYGVYVMLIEQLCESDLIEVTPDSIWYEITAGDFGISAESLQDIIEYCLKINLLQKENNTIRCKTLDSRLEPVFSKRRQSLEGLRGRNTTNGRVSAPKTMVSAPETTQSKVKESKGINMGEFTFEKFWNLYDKKVGDKERCRKKWNKLKEKDRAKIIETLPVWLGQFTDRQYQPYPATYLNQQRWNDEIFILNSSKFRRDINDSCYIGYCSACNDSDFYKTTNEDSRCCNSRLLPEKQCSA